MRKISIFAATAVMVVVAGCAVPTAGPHEPGRTSADPSRANSLPADAQADLLGEYPGFGITESQVVRDDTIALWEAWQRDLTTSQCMAESGFEWTPEVLYPWDAVAAVAVHLGVVDLEQIDPESPPLEDVALRENMETRAGLARGDLDAYYRGLVGESLADVEYMEHNGGAIPESRQESDFMQGGCAGASLEAVGSVWDAKRALAAERLELVKQTMGAETVQRELATLSECAAELGATVMTLEDLDRIAADDSRLALEVEENCLQSFDSVYASARTEHRNAFADSHREELTALTERSAQRYQVALEDEAFAEFLSDRIID